MRAPPALLLLLAMITLPLRGVAGHDVEFSEADRAGLTGFVNYALEAKPQPSGRYTAELVRGAIVKLASVTPAAIGNIEHLPAWAKIDEPSRGRVLRLLGGVRFARMAAEMQGAESLSALYCSQDVRAAGELLLGLGRNTDSPALEKLIVNVLASDSRPEMRVIAGRMAKILCVAYRPSPGLLAVAEGLLIDEDPSVSYVFAAEDAYDFRNLSILDKMVSLLGDSRRRPSVQSGILRGGDAEVGELIRTRLAAEWKVRAEVRQPQPASESGEDLAVWWKKYRGSWPQVVDSSWELVHEGSLLLSDGSPATFTVPEGGRTLSVMLSEYAENWFLDIPVLTTEVSIRAGAEPIARAANNDHEIGFILDGRRGSAKDRYRLRALVLPKARDAARVWFQLLKLQR